jgi:nucleoside-diphosphate-sugar epimerase
MEVHITGAGGFVGSALTTALSKSGHNIVREAAGSETVVHLAGIAHRRASKWEYQEVNIALAERLARSAAAEGAGFLFMSSVKVHGEHSTEPRREASRIAPVGDYAESKARAEEALRAIPNLRLTILRPPLVYGPGVKANFLSLVRALARGWPLPLAAVENRRSLVYVGNLVDAIINCLNVPGTFLVSDGAPISTRQLCREIGDALGRPARLLPFPPALLPRKLVASLEVDDSLIRRTLNWHPPYTRQEGLQATADWYLGR